MPITSSRSRFPKVINVFETLSDVRGGKSEPLNKSIQGSLFQAAENIFVQTPQQFIEELVNVGRSNSSLELDINPVVTDQKAEKIRVKKAIRTIQNHDRTQSMQRVQELEFELRSIQEEVVVISSQSGIMESTRIAATSQLINPGEYHATFLGNLLSGIKSYLKKSQTVEAPSKKQGKGWVANYKKGGAKYLLSGEHYLSRSAG